MSHFIVYLHSFYICIFV